MANDDFWMARAKCREIDEPDPIFFPKKVTGRKTDYRAAKKICATCPVRVPCLLYAIAHSEPHGVWGGMSDTERKRLPYETKMKVKKRWYRKYTYNPRPHHRAGGR